VTEPSGGTVGRGLTRRVLAFAGLPFLSLITPFLFLPLLARIAGAEAWLAIAVGQSIGAFFALVVALGYNTVGPAMVAVAPPEERPGVLRASLAARLAVLVPAAVLAVAIAALVSPDGYRLVGALMSLAMVLTGLSSAWYMIGLGRAGLIALFEIAPRMLATVLAALILVAWADVLWYPILLIAASIGSVAAFILRTTGGRGIFAGGRAGIAGVVRFNRSAVATEVAAGAYNSLAVTFVSVSTSAAQAAAYVSGDKLYRIGQYSVSALGNALQGWVVEEQRAHFAARARRSFLLHLALGVIGLVVFALAGPWLSALLFGEKVAIDSATSLALGVATLGIALGTTLGRVTLVGLGARREFFVSVLLGAIIGIPAILVLAAWFGAAGGAWGLAIGELVSVSCQAVFVARAWNRPERTP
jgi:O-antigen/teichoic acid export membrane protein